MQRSVLKCLAAAVTRALEARRTALALEASEARFRVLSEAAPLGIFETDRSGACTYANARWRAIFGLVGNGATGRDWNRAVHADEREAVTLEWRRAVALALDFDRELRIPGEDGTVRHVRVLARPVPGEIGRDGATMHVGSVEDITERKLQELALRKSEALLEETGALADIGGWEFDPASDTVSWSDRTCRIHGVEPGYRPALQEATDFYAPEARSIIREAVRRSITDGRGWDLELPFVRADGRQLWVRAVGRAEFEGGKAVRVHGAFQDITGRVVQHRALERAHERMMLATESGRIGIWDWDVRGQTIDWTPQMYPLLGLPAGPERVTDGDWMERVHPDDREALRQLVRETLAEGDSLDAEFRVVHDDGQVRHLCVAARLTRAAAGEALRMLGAAWDVTPLRKLGDELAEQHELLHVTLQSITDAVVTVDAEARVTWLNPAAERLSGWCSDDALGRAIGRVCPLFHEETLRRAVHPVVTCLREGTETCSSEQSVLTSRRGNTLGIENSAAPIRSESGRLLGAVFVFRDVSERRRLSREMRYRATHDALTGLVNRDELETRLERALSRTAEPGVEHALMYIDLDRFKLVNDACGHSVGDRLLRKVSRLMAATMRPPDTLARTGGDEFVAILENCSGDRAQHIAQDICDRLSDFRFVHEGQRFHIGASIGLVPIDRRWTDIASPMHAADISCYAAKKAGRNRVHRWFDTDRSLAESNREARWVARLEQALDEDRFALYAQRIEHASAHRTDLHAEVLIRLRDDDGQLIQPGAFLPAAERFHLATRIDRWVLRQVIGCLTALPDLAAVGTLGVNVSGQSIGDRRFPRRCHRGADTSRQRGLRAPLPRDHRDGRHHQHDGRGRLRREGPFARRAHRARRLRRRRLLVRLPQEPAGGHAEDRRSVHQEHDRRRA